MPDGSGSFLSDTALGIALAVFAANAWAISYIFTRMGLQAGIKPAQGTLVSLLSSFVIAAGMAAVVDLNALLSVPVSVLLFFAAVGIVNFPIGRLLNFLAVARLGVSRAAPVLAASPIFALIAAMLTAGERPSATVIGGTVAILAGISIIMTDRSA